MSEKMIFTSPRSAPTLVLRDVAFSASAGALRRFFFIFVVKLLCCGWTQRAEPAASPSAVISAKTHFCLFSSQGFVFRSVFPFLRPSPARLSAPSALCLPHSRCGHWRHVLGAALHDGGGGVAGGARGPGGAARELRDLLQGEGDRLQGESSRTAGTQGARSFIYFPPQEGIGIATPPNSFDWSLLQRLFLFCRHLADFSRVFLLLIHAGV